MTKISSKSAKDRLLEAAVKSFAMNGYNGTSTRMLVKEADVNISAIPYYFENKEGLYEAVLWHIISKFREERAEKAQEIRNALAQSDLSHEKARDLLHDFMGSVADFLLSEQASPYMGQIMVREQMQPSFVFDRFYDDMMKPMHETLTRLVAHLMNKPAENMDCILCTHAIFGQTAIFKTHKEMIFRRMGWTKFGENEAKAIKEIILKNTDAIIAAHRKSTP